MSVSAVGSIGFDPLEELDDTPLPFSPAKPYDSIGQAEPVTVLPTRPQLPPPDKNYMYRLFDLQKEGEALTDGYVASLEEGVQEALAEKERLSLEKVQAIQKYASEVAAQQTWGAWTTVAQYITTAASVVLGISLLSVAPVAGGLLIASGGLGLANRVLNDLGVWNTVAHWIADSEEKEREIAQWIDTGVYFTSLALGLAGGVSAYYAGAFALAANAASSEISQKIGQIMGIGGAVFGAGTRLGGAVSQKRALHIQAELKRLESELFSSTQAINEKMSEARKTLELETDVLKQLAEAIHYTQVSFD